ncbi:uncharacterized protein LOC112082914 [Eutrema salsugineum]|uniref:uncharacterized protein LOC112082914 n=1 Tax=Eutrema salsugineum TaxID=72664 RepID=UPI000CED1A86|nr:uncharacterized protein LOC112082914 [Eutrema salsugineum]
MGFIFRHLEEERPLHRSASHQFVPSAFAAEAWALWEALISTIDAISSSSLFFVTFSLKPPFTSETISRRSVKLHATYNISNRSPGAEPLSPHCKMCAPLTPPPLETESSDGGSPLRHPSPMPSPPSIARPSVPR